MSFNTLLAGAILAGDWARVMARLVTHPAEATLVCSGGNQLPLLWACSHRVPLEVVQALLHAHPAAVFTPDDIGVLPLHFATGCPLDVVQLLLRTYPQAASIVNAYCYLPLHYAAQQLQGETPATLEVVAALLAVHPEAALARTCAVTGSRLPDLTRYPADALGTAVLVQAAHLAAARRTRAMLAWAHYRRT